MNKSKRWNWRYSAYNCIKIWVIKLQSDIYWWICIYKTRRVEPRNLVSIDVVYVNIRYRENKRYWYGDRNNWLVILGDSISNSIIISLKIQYSLWRFLYLKIWEVHSWVWAQILCIIWVYIKIFRKRISVVEIKFDLKLDICHI